MKKTAIQIIAAVLLCTALMMAGVLLSGKTLTLAYEVPPEASALDMRFAPEGIVETAGSRVNRETGEVEVSFAPLSAGETTATILWEGVSENSLYAREMSTVLTVTKNGIITDSITYNFTGWEYLVVSIALLFLLLAVIFCFAYRREIRKSISSYRAASYLGLSMFFFILSMLRSENLWDILRGRNPGTVWALLMGMTASAQTFIRWTAPAIAVFALVLAASNIALMRHEGVRASNMLGIAVAALTVLGAVVAIWMSYSRLIYAGRNEIINVYSGVFAYFECLLAATVICALQAGRHTPAPDKDYIVILGCRIRPDGTLYPLIRARVDRAVRFAQEQLAHTGKRAVLVPSGGKGADEPMAEAEAMAAYMRENGVPEEDILIENRSGTTLENMRFSKELIEKQGKGCKAAFATSSYHVFRGGILAKESGWEIDGMGAGTKWYFWPNAFIREFVGLLVNSKVQQIISVGVIAALSWALTLII